MGKKTRATATSEETPKPVFIPPDGGWGWVIVFASALSNLIVIPIMQSFGLLFKDTFADMGMSGTDCSVIINVNSAFGMGLGLINGPLQRRFGFRKVGMFGSLLVFVGVTYTSRANSFLGFLISYSIVTSLGISLVMSSFSLALNTYFKVRRGKAAGFSMTATGLGPILMPQLISYLIETYGVSGTALILGGMSLHAFAAALLLQPVKWHAKTASAVLQEKEEEELDKALVAPIVERGFNSEPALGPRTRTITVNSMDREIDSQSIYGFETPMIEKRNVIFATCNPTNVTSRVGTRRSVSQTEDPNITSKTVLPFDWFSSSLETVNLGSSMAIFDERRYEPLPRLAEDEDKVTTLSEHNRLKDVSTIESIYPIPSKTHPFRRAMNRIVVYFDLDLLKDPKYVCLVVGMGLAITAEINFSLLIPFIMGDLGFETRQIAIIMSTMATSDILFRFMTPFVADAFKYSPKRMFFISMVFLIISRTTMTFFSTYTSVLCVGVFLGMGKGIRTVYMTLVIPAYVPLERLPGASGIQSVSNGIFIMVFGPLLGVIRDWSGNYNTCITAINVLASVTLIIWSAEYLVSVYKNKRSVPVLTSV